MPVHLRVPGPPLGAYVENFWSVMDHPSAWAKERILPDSGIEMIFNLGEPQRLHDRQGNGPGKVFRNCWFSGQRTKSIVIAPTPRVNLFGIRFRPWGAAPFLGQPLIAAADEVVDLEHFWGEAADQLHEQLMLARTPQDRFRIAETTLLDRLRMEGEDCRLTAAATHRLKNSFGPASVSDIAAELGVGQRRLARVFERTVGLSPKQLQRVCRFQQAIQRIGHASKVDWVDLAQCCGYHDQAHFIHEFTEFTTLTPTSYLRRRGEYLNYVTVD